MITMKDCKNAFTIMKKARNDQLQWFIKNFKNELKKRNRTNNP